MGLGAWGPMSEFATDRIMDGVLACEDDYITHQGEVIGDTLEIDELSRECLPQLLS